jgi:hypothetical protein
MAAPSLERLERHDGAWPDCKEIGRGSHSRVFSSLYAAPGDSSVSAPPWPRPVIVKAIVKGRDEPEHVVANEICILRHLWPYSDAHMVQYVAALQDDTHYYLVAEQWPGAVNLVDHLDGDGSLPLALLVVSDPPAAARKLVEIRRIVTNLVVGLRHLHSIGVAHRGNTRAIAVASRRAATLTAASHSHLRSPPPTRAHTCDRRRRLALTLAIAAADSRSHLRSPPPPPPLDARRYQFLRCSVSLIVRDCLLLGPRDRHKAAQHLGAGGDRCDPIHRRGPRRGRSRDVAVWRDAAWATQGSTNRTEAVWRRRKGWWWWWWWSR